MMPHPVHDPKGPCSRYYMILGLLGVPRMRTTWTLRVMDGPPYDEVESWLWNALIDIETVRVPQKQ